MLVPNSNTEGDLKLHREEKKDLRAISLAKIKESPITLTLGTNKSLLALGEATLLPSLTKNLKLSPLTTTKLPAKQRRPYQL